MSTGVGRSVPDNGGRSQLWDDAANGATSKLAVGYIISPALGG